MPPSKRSSTKTSAGTAPRAKRGRSSATTSMAISDSVALPASDATSSWTGTVSIDVAVLSATVSADELADILQDGHASGTNRGGAPTTLNDSRPQSTFTSISVPLSSRVSAKLKAKIFANEYVDLGALLSSSRNNEGEYPLSMAPSEGSSSRPQITLEPLQNAKRIQSIQQWVSAFNIFVSVYSEKFTAETQQLMKYCEVVRDLAQKAGD